MTSEPQVVLVDLLDQPIGTASKAECHRRGLLHRAFSVFLVDAQGRVLLQRRALGKYHSGGLWANTCCSHPAPGEAVLDAAARRLREELAVDATGLVDIGTYVYMHCFAPDLREYEADHVVVGRYLGGEPKPNPDEVDAVEWIGLDHLAAQLVDDPDRYAAWVPGTAAIVMNWHQSHNGVW